MKRLCRLLLATVLLPVWAVLAAPASSAAEPGRVIIQFGRSTWQATTDRCTVRPAGALTLRDAAVELQRHGLYGVLGVIPARTYDPTRMCFGGHTLQSSWSDIRMLADTYGWKVNSQTMSYRNLTTLSRADVESETIGSLDVFYGRGYPEANGALWFPDNKSNDTSWSVVKEGFGFGRKYSANGLNTIDNLTAAEPTLRTRSVNGGRCRDTSLPCSTMEVNNGRLYTSPFVIARALSPRAGETGAVQWYRWVEGSYGSMGDGLAWDCRGTDWRRHWTSKPEMYCAADARLALSRMPAGVTATHSAELAASVGRL